MSFLGPQGKQIEVNHLLQTYLIVSI